MADPCKPELPSSLLHVQSACVVEESILHRAAGILSTSARECWHEEHSWSQLLGVWQDVPGRLRAQGDIFLSLAEVLAAL